jgi:hypothetical protein
VSSPAPEGRRRSKRATAGAATRPSHHDPRLRGRRYAIPFDRVWKSALRLAAADLRGWTVESADEIEGVIVAQARALLFRFVDDVEVRIGLDLDGQTRVDVTSTSRRGRWDLGTNARRIRHFLRRLDRKVGAAPDVILAPEEGARPR